MHVIGMCAQNEHAYLPSRLNRIYLRQIIIKMYYHNAYKAGVYGVSLKARPLVNEIP